MVVALACIPKEGLVYVFRLQRGCQIVTATIPTIKLKPDFNDLACSLESIEILESFPAPPITFLTTRNEFRLGNRLFGCYNAAKDSVVKVSLVDTSRRDRQRPGWCFLVVVLAIFALSASLATRTSVPTEFHGTTALSASAQATRQHLDGDAIQWVVPTPVLTALEAPSFYPRFSPAGPPLPNLLFDESLYNRPPPSC